MQRQIVKQMQSRVRTASNMLTKGLLPVALLLGLAGNAPAQSGSGAYSSITAYGVPTTRSAPLGITAGPDGAMWFAESAGNNIGRITTAGTVTEYPVPTAGGDPGWITAGPDGALWFTEYFRNNVGRITTDGVVTEYPVTTAHSGPAWITAGPDGALWFTENVADKIGRITTSGVVTEYPVPTSGANPSGIAAGSDGALWFTEQTQISKIGRITTAGAITEYTVAFASEPLGITAGPDGALWFTEFNAFNIGQITTSGVVTEYPLPKRQNAEFIAAGPDGALWFTQVFDYLGRITTAGVVTEYPVPITGGKYIMGIAPGPDGNLWFADYTTNQIERAPACGLGFSASFAGTTLTLNFNLAIDTPATFNILLHSASGITEPFSQAIPATVPPYVFTMSSTDFPDLGDVTVQPVLTAGPGQVICSEWTTVNTAP